MGQAQHASTTPTDALGNHTRRCVTNGGNGRVVDQGNGSTGVAVAGVLSAEHHRNAAAAAVGLHVHIGEATAAADALQHQASGMAPQGVDAGLVVDRHRLTIAAAAAGSQQQAATDVAGIGARAGDRGLAAASTDRLGQ